MDVRANGKPALGIVEYDLHGLLGVRLVGATLHDAAAVGRQLGLSPAPLRREADITVRFVDRLPIASRLRYLGVDQSGFTDDAFLVLRSPHKGRARVQISLERVGRCCEITSERGITSVPLLVPILNLTALAKGVLPLHASAFEHEGAGIVATGWSRAGKTGTLLAFLSRGAHYIGAEWVYVSDGGRLLHGVPQPIRVRDWHLQHLPQYRRLVGVGDRSRWMSIRLARTLHGMLPHGARRLGPMHLADRLIHHLEDQLHTDLAPEILIGGEHVSPSGQFDVLLFLVSGDVPGVQITPMPAEEAAKRMLFLLQHDQLDLMSHYLAFRDAFPNASNDLIESMHELQRERLQRIMADKPAYRVEHPHLVPVPELFEALEPFCHAPQPAPPAVR